MLNFKCFLCFIYEFIIYLSNSMGRPRTATPTYNDFQNIKLNFFIFLSILSNPYTDIKDRTTKALYVVKDRDEAIERYSQYFDMMYGGNIRFKEVVDEIYEKWRRGEDVYLECYCKPKRCHGDIIVEKLQKRFIKENFKKFG